MIVYVVEMHKVHSQLREHFILGVYSSKERAVALAKAETEFHNYAYFSSIIELIFDTHTDTRVYAYHKKVTDEISFTDQCT